MDVAFPSYVLSSHNTAPPQPPQKSLLDLVIEAGGRLGLVPQREAATRPQKWSHRVKSSGRGDADEEEEDEEVHGTGANEREMMLTTHTSWVPPIYLLEYCFSDDFLHAFMALHGLYCSSAVTLTPPALHIRDLRLPSVIEAGLCLRWSPSSRGPHMFGTSRGGYRGGRGQGIGNARGRGRQLHERQQGVLSLTDEAEAERLRVAKLEGLKALVLVDGDDEDGEECDEADGEKDCAGVTHHGDVVSSSFLAPTPNRGDEVPPLRGIQQAALPAMLLGMHTFLCGPKGCGKRSAAYLALASNLLARAAGEEADRKTAAHKEEEERNSRYQNKDNEDDAQRGRRQSEEEQEEKSLAPRAMIVLQSFADVVECARWLTDIFGADAFCFLTIERGSNTVHPFALRQPQAKQGGEVAPAAAVDSAGDATWADATQLAVPPPPPLPAAPLIDTLLQLVQGSNSTGAAVAGAGEPRSAPLPFIEATVSASAVTTADADGETKIKYGKGTAERVSDRRRSRSDDREARRRRRDSRSRSHSHSHRRRRGSRRRDDSREDRKRHRSSRSRHSRHRRRYEDAAKDMDRYDDEPQQRRHARRDHMKEEEYSKHKDGRGLESSWTSRDAHTEKRRGVSSTRESERDAGRRRRNRRDRSSSSRRRRSDSRHRRHHHSRHRRRDRSQRRRSSSSSSRSRSRRRHCRRNEEEEHDKKELVTSPTSVLAGLSAEDEALLAQFIFAQQQHQHQQQQQQEEVRRNAEMQAQDVPNDSISETAAAADVMTHAWLPRFLQLQVPILLTTSGSLTEALEAVNGEASALPLEHIRLCLVTGLERFLLPPLKQRFTNAYWIALVNALDVECQFLFTAGRMQREGRELIENTLLPDAGSRFVTWTQSDETVWQYILPEVHSVTVEPLFSSQSVGEDQPRRGGRGGGGDDGDETDERGRVRRGGGVSPEDIEVAKVSSVAAIVLEHFAAPLPYGDAHQLAESQWQGPRVVVFVSTRREQTSLAARLASALRDSNVVDPKAAMLRVTCDCEDFSRGGAEVLVIGDTQLHDPRDLKSLRYCGYVRLLVHYSLPWGAMHGSKEDVAECIALRSRAVLQRQQQQQQRHSQSMAPVPSLLLLTEHNMRGKIGALVSDTLQEHAMHPRTRLL